MNKEQLIYHAELKKRLAATLELLASLEYAASPAAPRLDGMPHTPGFRDHVGELAAEIADVKTEIGRLEAEITRSEDSILVYIATIEDIQIRMIFRLRFIRGMSWKDVAAAVGGGNTEGSVKKVCHRYIARGDPAQEGRYSKQKGEKEA